MARAVIDQLPDEEILYVGDTGNGPYGPLTVPQIRGHALAIGDDLAERGIKALVIACNTRPRPACATPANGMRRSPWSR